ncbi:MAG: hypothetical protein IT168_23895 [Bryobacterales bacterium]|nr:hypothetical protein [Bryobacterales bacterium]
MSEADIARRVELAAEADIAIPPEVTLPDLGLSLEQHRENYEKKTQA